MHPWDRLHRAVLGERLNEPRGLAKVLFARDRELKAPTTILGKLAQSTRGQQPKIKANTHVASPRPNAPLLKRIVRRPFRMDDPSGRTRIRLRDAVPWEDLARQDLPRPSEVLAASRFAITFGDPVREIQAMRDLDRPRPSAAGWLGDLSDLSTGEDA